MLRCSYANFAVQNLQILSNWAITAIMWQIFKPHKALKAVFAPNFQNISVIKCISLLQFCHKPSAGRLFVVHRSIKVPQICRRAFDF